MIIRYANGKKIEAITLARTEKTLRVVLRGSDDVLELFQVNGLWISEECEPVQIDFESPSRKPLPVPSEAECVCSHELAARLIHLLRSGSGDDELPIDLPAQWREPDSASCRPM